MNTVNYNSNRFLVHWMLSALLVWPMSLFLSLLLWTPVSLLLNFLPPQFSSEPIILMLEIFTLLIIPSLVIGYVLGETQKTLIHDELDWNLSHWLKLSIGGGISGGLLVTALFYFLSGFDERTLWILAMPAFMLVLSSFQWLEMRQVAREAWLWILANVTGACVFSGLLFINQLNPMGDNYTFLSFGLWILATLAQGMITGIVLLWLYDRPIIENEHELAPVYLEVHSNRDDS